MFTPKQRTDILKWGTLTLIVLCVFASMMHGLFFVALFQYYIPLMLVVGLLYLGYTKARGFQLTDEEIISLAKLKLETLIRQKDSVITYLSSKWK